MEPTCALFTPNERANSGSVGAMIPNPTATKKEAKTRTLTSLGNSEKGLENLFFSLEVNFLYPRVSPADSSRAAA